jgi:hypothetical protein
MPFPRASSLLLAKKYTYGRFSRPRAPTAPFKTSHLLMTGLMDGATALLIVLGVFSMVQAGPFWDSERAKFSERMGEAERRRGGGGKGNPQPGA